MSYFCFYNPLRNVFRNNKFLKSKAFLPSELDNFVVASLKRPNLSFSSTQTFRCLASFSSADLQIQLTEKPKEKPDPNNLVFGKEFSDHMLEIKWTNEDGWGIPRINPIHNLSFHPAAKVFHYSIELFEGMKAYRGVDNKIRLFRPECNMERMNNSATRSTLPNFDGPELIKCIKQLVKVDQEWVPYSTKSSLYIRPTLIGTEPSLGVSQSVEALLYVIIGPVGPYYPTGFKPVSLLADPQHVRAWKGGCGNYKMGSNYGPTIMTQIQAAQNHDCQQVLWLTGDDHQITEVGTMNFFMFWTNENGKKELRTPPLGEGTILPGVTRRSLIDLAKEWGEFQVVEEKINMKQLVSALEEKRVNELFGAGTACVVCPIDQILYNGISYHIPTMDDGAPVTMRLNKELTDIQFGRVKHDWAQEI